MSFFPTTPTYTGIDVSEGSTKIAVLRKSRKGWEVVHLKTFVPNEPVTLFDSSVVVSAADSRETLVRTCTLLIKKERDLKAALAFQLEPQLPYSTDKAVIQSQSIEKKSNGTVLTTFAIRHDHLQAHIERLNERGLEPERVTCTPYALAALTALFPQTMSPQFLVHEGEEEVTCVLVEQNKLLAARAFDCSHDMGTEIQKTILSFASTHKTKEFETILLLGKESGAIQKATQKTVLQPSTSTLNLSQEELIRYGLAIGTALAAEGIDFRQKTFTYPHKWRRIKKPLIACIALSFVLIGALFGLGQVALQKQKHAIERAYLSLFKIEGEGVEIRCPTTPGGYLSSLSQFEKEVHARPDTFPLLPAVPKVREFLAWLSTQRSIEVDTLHYTMIKRPDFSHKKERYKIKVELEFLAEDIGAANAFHDVLVSPNKFLDTKEEIQWTAGKGKYRTSFYLKDKTRYS